MSLKWFYLLPCFLLLCEGAQAQGELESLLGQAFSARVLCAGKKMQFMLILCSYDGVLCFYSLQPSCHQATGALHCSTSVMSALNRYSFFKLLLPSGVDVCYNDSHWRLQFSKCSHRVIFNSKRYTKHSK